MHDKKMWWPLLRGLPSLVEASPAAEAPYIPHHERAGGRIGKRVLPFRVRLVRTYDHLRRAVEVRRDAYARHLPTLAQILKEAEDSDCTANSVVFLAESKETGEAIGTMRIATNIGAPVEFETALSLPPQYRDTTIAHVARLGVRNGPDATLVKLALFKALHRYCLALQVEWIMVGAHPPIDRLYKQLGFVDVFDGERLVSLPSASTYDVRVMAFGVDAAERDWREHQHPLYDFMINEYCPDIEIFNSVSSMWARPRQTEIETVTLNNLPARAKALQ